MTSPRRVWMWLDSRAATRAVQAIAVVALLLSLFIATRQYQLAGCLANYSNAAAASSGQRIVAAEQDRQALDLMIEAVAGARSLPAEQAQQQVSAAFDTYLDARRRADEQRAKNPPPPPPSQTCR